MISYNTIYLTSKDMYVDILDKLEPVSAKIELTFENFDEKDELVSFLEPFLLSKSEEKTCKGKDYTLLSYKFDSSLCEFLKQYEGFFVLEMDKNGYYQPILTKFGKKDIAFYDEFNEKLFWTLNEMGTCYKRSDI